MVNMQKIEVGQTVKTKSGVIGEVTSINKKRTQATITVNDLDDKGNIISSTKVKSPLVELTIISEIENLGKAVEDSFRKTTEGIKQVADGYKNFAKQGTKKPKALKMKQVSKFAEDMASEMINIIALKSNHNFLTLQKKFLDTIHDAIQKESKVELLTDNKDKIVAQIDALTDTAYFINGTYVELGVTPNVGSVDKSLSDERYPIANRLFHQVTEFHKVGEHPVAEKPQTIDPNRLVDRLGYTIEEVVELIRATAKTEEEFNETANALLAHVRFFSRNYLSDNSGVLSIENQTKFTEKTYELTLGLIRNMNLSPNVFSDIVHSANMTKFYIDDNGEYYAKKRESDGKIMKSPDFVAPEPQIIAKINELLGE